MFCISNVFKDHAMEYQTEEDPFGALKSERLRETSCCDELRYGDVAMADLVIVFSETSGILISHFYERVFALP